MAETVMNKNALPEILLKLIPTEMVRLIQINGMIQLIPIKEIIDCPLRGLAADSNLTVDKMLAMSHDEKELR